MSSSGGMARGYVAFLDVLGFKELVARDYVGQTQGAALQAYTNTVREALASKPVSSLLMTDSGEDVEYVIFSDSIIINSTTDSDLGLLATVRASSRIFGRLLRAGVPIRGAISHGSYVRTREENGTFVAGAAILDAMSYEQQQEWTGIMLCPSVTGRHESLQKMSLVGGDDVESRMPWPLYLFWSNVIPFKAIEGRSPLETQNYEGFAVMPTTGDEVTTADVVTSLDDSRVELRRLRARAPNPIAQAKHERAIRFLDFHVQQWGAIAANGQPWRTSPFPARLK